VHDSCARSLQTAVKYNITVRRKQEAIEKKEAALAKKKELLEKKELAKKKKEEAALKKKVPLLHIRSIPLLQCDDGNGDDDC